MTTPATVGRLYEAHLRARLKLNEALRVGATTEAQAIAIHEAQLDSDRTHRAWELAEHDALGAARYGEAWPERRAQLVRDGVGPAAHGQSIEVPSVEEHATTLDPICEGDGMVPEFDGPYDCPGCSACVPLEGEVTP